MPSETATATATEREPAISADLLKSVGSKLSDTFAGADQASLDREAAAGAKGSADAAEKRVPVRQHTRRISRPEPEVEAEPVVEDQAGDAEGEDGKPLIEAGDQTPATDDGTIAPHLLNAAKRRGWTQDKIDRLIKADPDLAKETFEQLHKDANAITQQFATLGRAAKGQQPSGVQEGESVRPNYLGTPTPATQQGQQQQVPAASNDKFAFSPEIREHLDVDFTKGVLDPLEKYVNDFIAPRLNAAHEFVKQRNEEMLVKQFDGFFDGLKGYEGLYGGDAGKLTKSHAEARERVAQEADAIRTGAKSQGRNLTIAESLEMAHDLVSSNHQQQAARREISDQVRNRGRQSTIRPTHREASPTGRVDPLQDAERNAAKRMAKIGL